MTRELTGRHVLVIAVTAFAIIIGANLTMLFAATGSFPGLVVKNAYVASQGWNARTEAQAELGWTVAVDYEAGALRILLADRDGRAIAAVPMEIRVGRPTVDTDDTMHNVLTGPGGVAVPVDLDHGYWRVEMRTTDGTEWQTTARLFIGEPG